MADKRQRAGVAWEDVRASGSFQKLVRAKKKFVIPYVIFFIIFYFALPVSTSYFTFLNEKAIGSLNWAYLFAFAQFIMTWVLCLIYVKRANAFDQQAAVVRAEARKNAPTGQEEGNA